MGKPLSTNWAQKLLADAAGLEGVCVSVISEDESRIVFLRHKDRAEIFVDKRSGERTVYAWDGRRLE